MGTSSSPNFTATGLSSLTTYSFRVAANDAAGSSAQSTAINVTTLNGPPPPPPGSKVFAPYVDMGLTVDWQLLTHSTMWPNYAGKNYKYLLANGCSLLDDGLFAREWDGPV